MPKNHGRKNVAKNTWKLMMKGSPKLAIQNTDRDFTGDEAV